MSGAAVVEHLGERLMQLVVQEELMSFAYIEPCVVSCIDEVYETLMAFGWEDQEMFHTGTQRPSCMKQRLPCMIRYGHIKIEDRRALIDGLSATA